MMIFGSVLLLSAVVALVALLARLAGGRPTAFERFALSGLAIVLILGGAGIFAAEFLASARPPELAKANPADQDNVNANNPVVQLPPQSEPVSEQERQQLQWLHRTSAELFVDRPGFGMRRMIMPLQDVVNPPKLTSDTVSEGQQSGSQPPKVFDAAVMRKLTKDRDAHFAFHDLVNQQWRSIPTAEKEIWSVRSVQLVGLANNPTPVVYDSSRMPGMKEVKELPKRDLNAFEKRALESLRGGEHLVADKTGKEMRVMGPLFAGNRCMTCHEQKGQMLGAFSYVLERVPAPPKAEPVDLP